MSELEPGLENVDREQPPVPVREGLPSKYRMRADAHYVEQLDSALFSAPVRYLDVRSIDAPARDSQALAPAFVESVRAYGLLQPLLVRNRGSRFQVLSGARRLAAAIEVGLSEVPCLVQRVDDEQARALATAANTPAIPAVDAPVRPARLKPDFHLGAFAECLSGVASSAGLLTAGSALTQTVAVDLVRAEASRALRLLGALRVLRNDLTPARRRVSPRAVVHRVVNETEAERRLRGLALTADRDGATCPPVSGDEELLVAGVSALVVGASALLDSRDARTVSLGALTRSDGSVVFVAEHEGAELPGFWRSILAGDVAASSSVPGGTTTLSALMLLQAARQVAELHGGRMSIDCADGSTTLSIHLPVAAVERGL